MKRTIAQSDLRKASADRSHRTLKEIQGELRRKKPAPHVPISHLEKPTQTALLMLDEYELELAKRQAAKYLPKR